MGTFSVRAVIWNVAEPAKSITVDLLVDTGSTYTVIPGRVLEELGVKPIRAVRLRLADGRVVERALGEVGIEVEGFRASATPVVFGDEGIYLLGSVTLEQLGLAPDPVERRLKPTEVLLMVLRVLPYY
ncbi:aspartyl protease family protein [Vulcanisaeta sp. JCM 14467]|uniref:aspartyl protease family protein n=1 Tax=Vulcanisaeta sp. JCM 14467 TaxID=1295370 RepID=UPI0006D2653E|nr:aspartyl protease family protein [Vulcanisaeta sp. JCM 14467]